MSSRLLELPGELRNQIYEFAIPATAIHVTSSGAVYVLCSAEQGQSVNDNEAPAKPTEDASRKPLALLHTCRMIRHETVEIFYSRTVLVLRAPTAAEAFFTSLPRDTFGLITSIRLICSPYEDRRSPSIHEIKAFEEKRDHMITAPLGQCCNNPRPLCVVDMPSDASKSDFLECLPVASYPINPKGLWGEFEPAFRGFVEHVPFKELPGLVQLDMDVHFPAPPDCVNFRIFPDYTVGFALASQWLPQQLPAAKASTELRIYIGSSKFRIFVGNSSMAMEMLPIEARDTGFDVLMTCQRCRLFCRCFSTLWNEALGAYVVEWERIDWQF